MDSRLEEKLRKIDSHIVILRELEGDYFQLEASEKPTLAKIILNMQGTSHAQKENAALASQDWIDFSNGLAESHAIYLQAKRRYELLLKAFDAEYLSLKTDSQAIRRQV